MSARVTFTADQIAATRSGREWVYIGDKRVLQAYESLLGSDRRYLR